LDRLLELFVKFVGLPFEYPGLIRLLVFTLPAVTIAPLYFRYRWNYRASRRFRDLWLPVFAAYLISLPVFGLAGWCFYRYWGLPDAFAKNDIGILVAEVPEQTSREQQHAYQNALRNSIEKSSELRDVTKVRLIERPLPQDTEDAQNEALRIGHWLGATFILRPYVVGKTQEPWLTIVNYSYLFIPESRLQNIPTSQLAQLDSLPLPREIDLLAETAIVLALDDHGSYAEAAKILQDVIKSAGLSESAYNLWALHFLHALDLQLSGGASQEIIAEYQEAIRLKPDFAGAHNNLGLALSHEGQYDAAIAEYKEAIGLEDQNPEAHNNWGYALYLKGQPGAAIAEYKKAISLNPETAEWHCNLGIALDADGKLDAAIAELQEAIRLKPELAEAHDNLGIALYENWQHDAAVTEFKEAIRRKPGDAEAHFNLGIAQERNGQNDAAIAEFTQAIALKPDDAEAHCTLGTVLSRNGHNEAAIAELKEAIKLKPDYAEAHYNLGIVLEQNGQYDAAITEYKEANKFKPNSAQTYSNFGNALNGNGQHDTHEFKKPEQLKP
jgi:tetratricopeptide (TPR) repeat protein